MAETDEHWEPVLAAYLVGNLIGLRAPVLEDAANAQSWMIEADNPYAGGFTFPLTRERAEAQLREEETIPWGNNDSLRLVAVALDTDEIVGGAVVLREGGRTGWIRHQLALGLDPDLAPAIELELATLLIQWARIELDLMVIEYVIPADRDALISHVRDLDFKETARLTEALQGPSGRIDLLWMESVNENWGSRIARSGEESSHG